MKQTFILLPTPHPARKRAVEAILEAPDGYCVQVGEPNRNLSQNSAMWPILEAFSRQLQWPVNGAMEWLQPEEWKDILTAAFRQEQARVSPGLHGGMVFLGMRTSKFSKRQFSDFLEFLHATAAERDVIVFYPVPA